MLISSTSQGLVVIGAGPAGLAPLFAAASTGRLQELLRLGVTILEAGSVPGSGGLGAQGITSDSAATAFLDIVTGSREPGLRSLVNHPATRALVALGQNAAPLNLVSEFLSIAARALCDLVASSPRGQVLTETTALSVTKTSSGRWRTRFRCLATGLNQEIESTFVLLATGAEQPKESLAVEPVAGIALLPRYESKLLYSGQVLVHNGVARVRQHLRGCAPPKIVVVGGSTSAGSVAASLLRQGEIPGLGTGGITILHRKPLRIFYESVAAASAEDYNEFSPQDVCSLTGRVYRFSGFRLDSREIIMRARGIGGRPAEPRLKLLHLRSENLAEARQHLESADLIVAATGYRPRLLPIFDAQGQPLPLVTPRTGIWAVVDKRCRVLTREASALPNLFAIGLAVGPAPDETLGGEVGFGGQVNSLWMWQHVLGLRILDEIRANAEVPRFARTVHASHLFGKASHTTPGVAVRNPGGGK